MQQVDDTRLRWIWRIHSRCVCALDMAWFSSFTYWEFQQFNAALRVLFLPERPQNRVLQKYMDVGAFVLTIDDGREHVQLTDQEGWTSTIRGGMTIVMSVIMTQEVNKRTPTKYQCPFCDCWNKLKGNYRKSSIDWWVFHRPLQIWVLLINSQSIMQATVPGQTNWSKH